VDTGPERFRRRVLLCVTGLSPQIVTETLFALAVRQQPPFVPTEVRLITTAEGAERARLSLLSRDPGWFPRFVADYGLPGVAFDESHIHTLEGEDGQPLRDIRTPRDNERAADFITGIVREITADPHCALHASIAGGRKTMGYYLGYALSLFGRPQDRLSHVLVEDPYESSWEFFYPTPYSRVITTRDNKLVDTAQAEVSLAEIPFVSLRHGLDERLLDGGASFSEAVASAQRALAPPRLIVDLDHGCIQAGEEIVRLPPASLALLALYARRAVEGRGPVAAPPKGVPDPAWSDWYLAEYRAIRDEMADLDATERALARGMDGEYFSQRLSKLRRELRRALGPAARPYLISDGGTRPRRYRIELPSKAIRFGAPGTE
jgi:CRISPR-associated protein (TIGR02584 family)